MHIAAAILPTAAAMNAGLRHLRAVVYS